MNKLSIFALMNVALAAINGASATKSEYELVNFIDDPQAPSLAPSFLQSTLAPSTHAPTTKSPVSKAPSTKAPNTRVPTKMSKVPTKRPTSAPSMGPSAMPSLTPTGTPSMVPSLSPSNAPSSTPSIAPSTSKPTPAPQLNKNAVMLHIDAGVDLKQFNNNDFIELDVTVGNNKHSEGNIIIGLDTDLSRVELGTFGPGCLPKPKKPAKHHAPTKPTVKHPTKQPTPEPTTPAPTRARRTHQPTPKPHPTHQPTPRPTRPIITCPPTHSHQDHTAHVADALAATAEVFKVQDANGVTQEFMITNRRIQSLSGKPLLLSAQINGAKQCLGTVAISADGVHATLDPNDCVPCSTVAPTTPTVPSAKPTRQPSKPTQKVTKRPHASRAPHSKAPTTASPTPKPTHQPHATKRPTPPTPRPTKPTHQPTPRPHCGCPYGAAVAAGNMTAHIAEFHSGNVTAADVNQAGNVTETVKKGSLRGSR